MKRICRAAAACAVLAVAAVAAAQAPDGRGWVSAWTTAMQDPLPAGFAAGNPPPTSPQWAAMFTADRARDQTFRQIVRPLAGGEKLRIRLSNLSGDRPLTLQNVSIAPRSSGRAIVASASRRLTFGGAGWVTIAPGREAYSDVVDFALEPEKDVAVTMHLAGDSGAITWHAKALVTSYLNGPGDGDRTGDASGAALPHELRSWLWLAEIQAWRDAERSTIVAVGDSITDGTASTIDGHDRWPDVLNRRLRAAGSRHVVVNQGIGGNRVAALRWGPVIGGALVPPAVQADTSGGPRTPQARCDACGEPAVVRLERDVFALPNVGAVILFEGVNDVGAGASYGEIIAGLQDVALRARARGIKVYAATITPYYGFAYDQAMPDIVRRQVNDWIRASKLFDAVFDLDAVLRDPDYGSRLKPEFAAPDKIHPNPRGYAAIADAIPLSVLDPGLAK